jgi:hypothetical protein
MILPTGKKDWENKKLTAFSLLGSCGYGYAIIKICLQCQKIYWQNKKGEQSC